MIIFVACMQNLQVQYHIVLLFESRLINSYNLFVIVFFAL